MFHVTAKKESSPNEAANNKNNRSQYTIANAVASNTQPDIASVVSGYEYALQHSLWRNLVRNDLELLIPVYESMAVREGNGHALGMAAALREMTPK